jgi:hypothetical protein
MPGAGVAAQTVVVVVVGVGCYEVFSSTGHADAAQPHMATDAPETERRQDLVSRTYGNNRDIEIFSLPRRYGPRV